MLVLWGAGSGSLSTQGHLVAPWESGSWSRSTLLAEASGQADVSLPHAQGPREVRDT